MRKGLVLIGAAFLLAGCGTGGMASGHGDQQNGQKLFQSKCGGCHTLAAAHSEGTIGPNLDQVGPSKELVVERVTNGKGVMPSFKGQLTPRQIEDVAEFVATSSAAG